MLYSLFKWIHILAAITALGANATYGLWLSRAARSPEALLFTLKTIKVLDSRVANPAYGLSLLTGLVLVYLGRWPLTSSWIALALVLYVSIILLGIFVYAPSSGARSNWPRPPAPARPTTPPSRAVVTSWASSWSPS